MSDVAEQVTNPMGPGRTDLGPSERVYRRDETSPVLRLSEAEAAVLGGSPDDPPTDDVADHADPDANPNANLDAGNSRAFWGSWSFSDLRFPVESPRNLLGASSVGDLAHAGIR